MAATLLDLEDNPVGVEDHGQEHVTCVHACVGHVEPLLGVVSISTYKAGPFRKRALVTEDMYWVKSIFTRGSRSTPSHLTTCNTNAHCYAHQFLPGTYITAAYFERSAGGLGCVQNVSGVGLLPPTVVQQAGTKGLPYQESIVGSPQPFSPRFGFVESRKICVCFLLGCYSVEGFRLANTWGWIGLRTLKQSMCDHPDHIMQLGKGGCLKARMRIVYPHACQMCVTRLSRKGSRKPIAHTRCWAHRH